MRNDNYILMKTSRLVKNTQPREIRIDDRRDITGLARKVQSVRYESAKKPEDDKKTAKIGGHTLLMPFQVVQLQKFLTKKN